MNKAKPGKQPRIDDVDPTFDIANMAVAFLDTTWRIAIPVVALTILGIICDRKFSTKPWLTLAAVVVGFGIAGWLVKRQIATSERQAK